MRCQKFDLFKNLNLLSKPDKTHISRILKIGFPSSVQSMLFTCISMYIARLISAFGAISVAVQKLVRKLNLYRGWLPMDLVLPSMPLHHKTMALKLRACP